MPPVREVRGQEGEWGTVGQTRTIATTDGGTLLETLTVVDRAAPLRLRARPTCTGPMRPLVRTVDGVWSVAPEGGRLPHRLGLDPAPRPSRRPGC